MVVTLMGSHVFSHLSSWGRRITLALQMDAVMGSSGAQQHQTMTETGCILSVLKNLVRFQNRDFVFILTMTSIKALKCVDSCLVLVAKSLL